MYRQDPHEEHVETLAGLQVVDFYPGLDLENPEETAYRITLFKGKGYPAELATIGCYGILWGLIISIISVFFIDYPISIGIFLAITFLTVILPSMVWNLFLRKSYCPYCDAPLPGRQDVSCAACGIQWGTEEDKEVGQVTGINATLQRQMLSFIKADDADRAAGLLISYSDQTGWDGKTTHSDAPVEFLVTHSDRLPGLRAVFLTELTRWQCEISWIENGDVSPIFSVYPKLEHFQIRGCGSLSLGNLKHENLRRLIVESGGLSSSVVEEITAAELPRLDMLEIWTGSEEFGGDVETSHLDALLEACEKRFPHLKRLAIRNCLLTDDVARRLVDSPLAERLEILDLSLGTLSDDGGSAILDALDAGKFPNLLRLDLHHHYLSPEMIEKFETLNIEVDTRRFDAEYYEPDDVDDIDLDENGQPYRYCAISE